MKVQRSLLMRLMTLWDCLQATDLNVLERIGLWLCWERGHRFSGRPMRCATCKDRLETAP